MNKKKLLQNIIQSRGKNVLFTDFQLILESFGFRLDRTNGSHNMFKNPKINKTINIQNIKGQAKPYQIQQFLEIVEKYKLYMEE